MPCLCEHLAFHGGSPIPESQRVPSPSPSPSPSPQATFHTPLPTTTQGNEPCPAIDWVCQGNTRQSADRGKNQVGTGFQCLPAALGIRNMVSRLQMGQMGSRKGKGTLICARPKQRDFWTIANGSKRAEWSAVGCAWPSQFPASCSVVTRVGPRRGESCHKQKAASKHAPRGSQQQASSKQAASR